VGTGRVAQKLVFDISETQLRRYVREAARNPSATSDVLLQNLERRLDNIVYRLGFAPTIWGARQLVGHGHVLVDGRRVDVRSYRVRPGELITTTA
jgi:small subunit ribosomal protein S4